MAYKKLSIYLDEEDRWGKKPLWEEVLCFLKNEGVRGATVFKGVLGWGPDGVVHTVRLLRASGNLPLKIEVIEEEYLLKKLLPTLQKMVKKGLITLSDVEVIKS